MSDTTIHIKKSKSKKKKISILPTITLFLVIACFAASSYIAYEKIIERNQKFEQGYTVEVDEETAIEFRVPYNATTEEIAQLLLERNLIRSTLIFEIISDIFGYGNAYSHGTHLLNEGMEYEDIMIVLTSLPEIVRVTFPEGFTVDQIKARLIANGLAEEELFDKAEQELDLDKYDEVVPKRTRDHKIEGYLFPDTYEFDKNAGEEFIINRLINRFEELFDDDMIKRVKTLNTTIDDIVIMASLLEKEATTYDERRKIAGVYYNRLESDDTSLRRLQCDATLQYIIVKNGGNVKEILSAADTKLNDRYNTYIFSGLPPGPICSPGLQSIMAALYPENHDFFYYVVDPNGSGSHIFSMTYEEHLEAMGN